VHQKHTQIMQIYIWNNSGSQMYDS